MCVHRSERMGRLIEGRPIKRAEIDEKLVCLQLVCLTLVAAKGCRRKGFHQPVQAFVTQATNAVLFRSPLSPAKSLKLNRQVEI